MANYVMQPRLDGEKRKVYANISTSGKQVNILRFHIIQIVAVVTYKRQTLKGPVSQIKDENCGRIVFVKLLLTRICFKYSFLVLKTMFSDKKYFYQL